MIKNLYFLNEILHQVWKSCHRNCINLSNGSELTVQWQSPRTFYHYITRINTISMAWFSKHWKFKHFKKFMKIQKNSPNFHCIEFFKFNNGNCLDFSGISTSFLMNGNFHGNYVRKINLLNLKCLEFNDSSHKKIYCPPLIWY